MKRGTDCTSTDGLIALGEAPDTNRTAGLDSNNVVLLEPTLQQSSLPAAGLTCLMHLRFHVWQGKGLHGERCRRGV